MNFKQNAFGIGALILVSLLASAAQQKTSPRAKPFSSLARTQDEGQRVFERHCSRCHTAPEGFSPRISGTIVRHMRVRASLSQHEEEALLRFFNP